MAVTSGLDESGVPRTYDLDGLRRRAGVFSLRAKPGAAAPPTEVAHWEVLMISSLSKERLIIPAGGIDPDELPCCAAVREGYEEAGIDMHAVLAAARERSSSAKCGDEAGISSSADGSSAPCCSPLACNACLPLSDGGIAATAAALPVEAGADTGASVSAAGAGNVECPWSAVGGAAASPRSPRCTCICDRVASPAAHAADTALAAANAPVSKPEGGAAIRGPVPLGLSVSAGKHTRTHYFLLTGVPLLPDGTYLEGALRKRRWVSLGDAMQVAEALKAVGPLTDEQPAAGAGGGGSDGSAAAPKAAVVPSDAEISAPLADATGGGPNVLARRAALALLDARSAIEAALRSLYG